MDPTEPLGLAKLACNTGRDDELGELLRLVDALLAIALENLAAEPENPRVIIPATLLAVTLAGTPNAGLPSASL